MDPDPIPTEPTTDPGSPEANLFADGPSQAWGSPAAGRGRGSAIRRVAIGLALVLTFGVGIGVGRFMPSALGGIDGATPGPTAGSGPDFDLIAQAWQILHEDYVGADELDNKALAYAAIQGLTDAVGDTGHTSFLTPKDRADRAEELSGSYVGIGVRIGVAEDGRPLVAGVFRGSPAEAARLAPGDIFISVDGQATDGHALDEVAGWIRGEAGTTVRITVRHGADGADRDVSIVRAAVKLETVSWAMVPGTRTAMLRLEDFSHGAADAVKAALGAIRTAGADRVVFDLRGNTGGFVDEAIGVASQFLKSGNVFIERDAAGKETEHPVSPDGADTDLPLVVLIDAGTASSAEIVSGAIQDAGRAELIGITTFGTGTVLGEFELADGSALRVGTVEWLTPKGRRIWHEGIVPDVKVERADTVRPIVPDDLRTMTAAEASGIDDPQVARALSAVASAAAPTS